MQQDRGTPKRRRIMRATKILIKRQYDKVVECKACTNTYGWIRGLTHQDKGFCSTTCYLHAAGNKSTPLAIPNHATVTAREWLAGVDTKLSRRKKKKLNRSRLTCLGHQELKTPEWYRLRFDTLDAWGNRCVKCKSDNKALKVVHIESIVNCPERAYDFTNLQVMCKHCLAGLRPGKVQDCRPGDLAQEAFEKYIYFKELRDKDSE